MVVYHGSLRPSIFKGSITVPQRILLMYKERMFIIEKEKKRNKASGLLRLSVRQILLNMVIK